MTKDCTGIDQKEEESMIEVEPERTSKDQGQELDQDHNPVKPDMSEEEVYTESLVPAMVWEIDPQAEGKITAKIKVKTQIKMIAINSKLKHKCAIW